MDIVNNLVSIIIPTFNRAHLIGETLDSIIAQTHKNWECIIVDDQSTDNTKDVVLKYTESDARFKFYVRPKTRLKGPNSCRNLGFYNSNGKFIQWLDSDDLLIPIALESYLNGFDELGDTDVLVAKLQLMDMISKEIYQQNKIVSENLIEDYIVGKITFYVSGPMWKKDFLKQQPELFSENITYLDDWDFNLRMLYAEPKINFLEIPLILYRLHSHSLSQEIRKLNYQEINSEIRARNKHLDLITKNKKANPELLNKYILRRYKVFVRRATVQKSHHRYFFLKILMKKQLNVSDFSGMFRSLFGFVLYETFNKGYKFLN